MKKLFFLFLALLFPVAIFVFLKMFGRNEFDVPVLYEEGTVEAPAGCGFPYTAPYRVADSVVTSLGLNPADSLYVLYFDPALETPIHRITVAFSEAPVHVVAPGSVPKGIDQEVLQKCVLLMKPPASVVLLDYKRRIRGYYQGDDRDEVDRLIVEIKIILKQY